MAGTNALSVRSVLLRRRHDLIMQNAIAPSRSAPMTAAPMTNQMLFLKNDSTLFFAVLTAFLTLLVVESSSGEC